MVDDDSCTLSFLDWSLTINKKIRQKVFEGCGFYARGPCEFVLGGDSHYC